MQGNILVTTEQLISTAEEFQAEGTRIAQLTSEMMNRVTSLASAWEGEAAAAYINKFKSLEDDIQKMIRMVQEHVNDLETMAQAYTSAENQNLQDIATLSSDVII